MLSQDIKRKIDSARDVLVGKVPDPKSQVEQITTALIYKFMDDTDKEAIEIGGKPRFFTGDFEKYSWSKILDPKLGGHERFDLYDEAIKKMSLNPKLDQLFRDIFKDAFLPYRSPETLNLFLKETNNFQYEDSEQLGDAFEYLLSIMGVQGDAGQFRTPRHIIDFIVAVVDPQKDETILDPACGTAGFLISAYKHIREKNKEKLTPDEKTKLMNQIVGYDIAPEMVRMSKVNMYLHEFPNPKIYEYDTLSSEDRWQETFDVILTNPPFMSPKGGIKPHKRFSVQANRSEVLFVDYILEHLNLNGRAGVIVPEGIIFKSENAYKHLRKLLIEDGLLAVISLPSGVFNPYAGVKTSILVFDKPLAKKTKHILFVKIQNDGFDLGAQRRPVVGSDLPMALEAINGYRKFLATGGEPSPSGWPKISEVDTNPLCQFVSKEKIAASGDYNLTGDRYKETTTTSTRKWPMIELGELCTVERGTTITKVSAVEGNIPVIAGGQQPAYYHNKSNREGKIITVSASGAYAGFVNYFEHPIFASDCTTIKPKNEGVLLPKFTFLVMKLKQEEIYKLQKGMGQPHVHGKDLVKLLIPLPPIEIQKEIVEEIEGYQKIIDGAKQVVENWRPKIDIDPEWPTLELREIGRIRMCKRIFKEQTKRSGDVPFYKIGTFGKKPDAFISQELFKEYKCKYPYPRKGAILLSTSGTIGRMVAFDGEPAYFQDSNIVWIDNDEKLISNEYLYYIFQSVNWATTKGGTIERLYSNSLEKTIISSPSLVIQNQIVQKIKDEEAVVEANKKLIEIYEKKIDDTVGKLWDE
jgi:type I restriction enzyme M protein